MAAGEVVSVALTAVFGLVSSVGIIYQMIDIRRRSRMDYPAAVRVQAPEPHRTQPAHWPAATAPITTLHSDGLVISGVPQTKTPSFDNFSGPPSPLSASRHTPRAIVRTRQLMLVLSVLTIAAVGLLMYTATTVDPVEGEQAYSSTENAVYGTIFTLIIASPLAAAQTLLSIKIGARRNWARITALVLLLGQAGMCTCIGGVAAAAGFTSADDGFTGASNAANLLLGTIWIVFGIVAVAASAMLLTRTSNEYFSLGATSSNAATQPRSAF